MYIEVITVASDLLILLLKKSHNKAVSMNDQSNTYTPVNLHIVLSRLIPFILLYNFFIIMYTVIANIVILHYLYSADSYYVFIIYRHGMQFLFTFVLVKFLLTLTVIA